MNDIQLYIGYFPTPVDLPENFSVSMTYQSTDYDNPTAVKNNYSQSIILEGTKNNNNIFGQIYKLDRNQIFGIKDTVVGFNPLKKTSYKLFRGNELISDGYIKMEEITNKGGQIKYRLTLFGGLGQFIWNLTYNDKDEKLSLFDLQYFIVDKNGNELPKDEEMDFRINKNIINDSWNKLGKNGNELTNFLTFAPTYQGKYSNFDSNKCLINTNLLNVFANNPKYTDPNTNEEYVPFKGFIMANMNDEMTEWEMKELRSQYQKPLLKFNKLFNTMCDPRNNGGYRVVLDSAFFNPGNPYWESAYLALPMLSNLKEQDGIEDSERVGIQQDININDWVGYEFGTGERLAYDDAIKTSNGEIITSSADYIIDCSKVPPTASINLSVNFDVKTAIKNVDIPKPSLNFDELYLSRTETFAMSTTGSNLLKHYSSYLIQFFAYDYTKASAPVFLAASPLYDFTNLLGDYSPNISQEEIFNRLPDPSTEWEGYVPDVPNSEITAILGHFYKDEALSDANNTIYNFKQDFSGLDKFVGKIENIRQADKIKIVGKMSLVGSRSVFTKARLSAIRNYKYSSDPNRYEDYLVPAKGTFKTLNTPSSFFEYVASTKNGVVTNSLITKKMLLKTDKTPADYFLSYLKMFGLKLEVDSFFKKVKISTRNTYYRGGSIINIDKNIDRNADNKINPLLASSKYYLMNYEDADNQYLKKYKLDYDKKYGVQVVDTNYSFNNTETPIYNGVFQNIVPILNKGKYYYNCIYTNELGYTGQVPTFAMSKFTTNLYKKVGSAVDYTQSVEVPLPDFGQILEKDVHKINQLQGYDAYDKICLFDEGDSLADISNGLVLFTGFKEVKDFSTNKNVVKYRLTDDLPEMLTLNGNPCWLYSEFDLSNDGRQVSITRRTIPSFSKYLISNNAITVSLDFGTPKEIYIPNITYSENSNIYNRFWGAALSDAFDVNTRKFETTVVNPPIKMDESALRNIYYFDNSLFLLNKINGYDFGDKVNCEFIKINDIDNYIEGQKLFDTPTLDISPSSLNINYLGEEKEVIINSKFPWALDGKSAILRVTPTSGDGSNNVIKITALTNNTLQNRELMANFKCVDYDIENQLEVTQTPNLVENVRMYGVVKTKNNSYISNCKVVASAPDSSWENTDNVENGAYSLYVRKNEPISVKVFKNGKLIAEYGFPLGKTEDFSYDIIVDYDILLTSLE